MSPPPPIARPPRFGRRHILTVVLEDYCHVGPVSRVVSPGRWHRFESRLADNTRRTLDLLDEVGARATFFILGWIGEHHPEIVAEVARRGHEVAAKGYWHRAIGEMSEAEFRADVRRSKDAVEQAAGVAVRGFRIARGGLAAGDLWALDVLAEEGFAYDSSVRPLGRAFAGDGYRRHIHLHRAPAGRLWEVPLSTWRLGRLALPVSGGNFVRQLPHAFISRALDRIDRQTAEPIVFYFHVWELDPEQPRITAVSRLDRIRQYRNLHRMGTRIRYYLGKYRFATVADHLRLAPPPAVAIRPPARPTTIDSGSPAAAGGGSGGGPRTPVTVVVPCYNEEAGLGYTANTLAAFKAGMRDAFDVSFVLVDDGSRDRTWERLNTLFGDQPDCRLVRHERNRGVAAAVLTGVRHAATDIVAVIDCDGTYDPLQLRAMIPLLAPGVDAVTASPYHPDGKVLNLAGHRLMLSKGLSVLYRRVHRNKLYTYTACFRVYRRRAVADLALRDERFVGIAEILSAIDRRGGTIAESPAVMEVRLLGASKMKTLKTIFGHLRHLGRLIGDRLAAAVFPKVPAIKEKCRDSARPAN